MPGWILHRHGVDHIDLLSIEARDRLTHYASGAPTQPLVGFWSSRDLKPGD